MKNESFIYNTNATYSSMKEFIQELQVKDLAMQLCARYSLNLNILKPLFELSMKGYNNAEIAQKIGVHRITIQRYVAILKNLKESEFQDIYQFVLREVYDEKRNKN